MQIRNVKQATLSIYTGRLWLFAYVESRNYYQFIFYSA